MVSFRIHTHWPFVLFYVFVESVAIQHTKQIKNAAIIADDDGGSSEENKPISSQIRKTTRMVMDSERYHSLAS